MYALAGQEQFVHFVDISEQAIAWFERNCELNHFSKDRNTHQACDACQCLNEHKLDDDFIILAPPAFDKQSKISPKLKGKR
jgi:23S rRNA G2069 N7-methylase RlmK/C1962 C5-methylase RlmI